MLPVPFPVSPMLAKATREIPDDGTWSFEPKWDGFRAIVFRDGDDVEIGSRNEKPLTRYFPELLDPLRAALPERAVVDGEIVIATERGLDFDLLSQRIHPAASRITKLSQEIPATFVGFDLLAEGDDDLRTAPFSERRARLDRALAGLTGGSARGGRACAAHAGHHRPRGSRPSGSSTSRARASTASSPRRSRGSTARASARCSR